MNTPRILRAHLLLALSLTACEPGLPTVECEDAAPITALPDFEMVTGEICGPPVIGACPTSDEVGRNYITDQIDQEVSEDCFLSVDSVCGPSVATEDSCCYTVSVMVDCVAVGRPLRVDEQVRRADPCASTRWLEANSCTLAPCQHAGMRWLDNALTEHASIASFAAFSMELLAAGAPEELVRLACEAQADEVRHARESFAVASHLLARPVGPGRLPIQGLTCRGDTHELLISTIIDGCVNESLAAAEAMEGATRCSDPHVAEVLRGFAADELAHATLAWKTVRWLVAEHPALRAVAERTLDAAVRQVPPVQVDEADAAALHDAGLLTSRERTALARETLRQVVRPIAQALFVRDVHA